MQVRVLFFGMLKDIVGQASDSLDLGNEATVGDLVGHLESRFPKLKEMSGSIATAVNSEYSSPEWKLRAGDEVALLPPVSGGSPRASITRTAIDTNLVLSRVKRPEDGAAVVFEGVVRDNTRGRKTLYLDYESYEDMAVKQMEGMAEQAMREFKVREVEIVHRLGRLEIGEISVLIVVASAHRGPAFEACRWVIDTLKKQVPIWKKEYFDDGAVWADGEPFPPELVGRGTPSEGDASK
jgi:MoaE-MoaD fusion protein